MDGEEHIAMEACLVEWDFLSTDGSEMDLGKAVRSTFYLLVQG